MKVIFSFLVLLSCFNLKAQTNEEVISASLEFLNIELHLNLEKENVPILVKFNSIEYVYNKYSADTAQVIDLRIRFTVEKMKDGKYSFILVNAGEIKGTFEVTLKENKCRISDLKYISRKN